MKVFRTQSIKSSRAVHALLAVPDIKLCAVAAKRNSSWAPLGPRKRNWPSFKDAFEMGKQHLHHLSLPARHAISLGLADGASDIAYRFLGAAVDLSGDHVGPALRLRLADLAVKHTGPIAKQCFRLASPGWP